MTALVILFPLGTVAVQAQEKPGFSVMAQAGYRTTGGFAIESEEVAYSRLKVEGGPAFSLTVRYTLNESLALEGVWSRSSSSLRGVYPVEDGLADDRLFNVSEDNIQANLILWAGYMIGRAKPYFLAGLGLTSLNPAGGTSGATRFSWSLGTGFDWMLGRKIGVKAQLKTFSTYINTMEKVLYEWVGGYQAISVRNSMMQWEFTGGLIYRF